MPTMDEAVQALIDTTVDVGVSDICQRVYKSVPIFLVFCDAISMASEDRLVEYLSLATDL